MSYGAFFVSISIGGQISTNVHFLPVPAVVLYMYQQLWSQISGFLCADDHYEGEMTSGKFQGVRIGSGVYMNKQKKFKCQTYDTRYRTV